MAAFTGTPTGSAQYNKQITAPVPGIAAALAEGRLKVAPFSYTHAAGAGTGEINLFKLPAGPIILYPALCRILTTAFVATADLHLGYRAHVDQNGAAVVADDNAFADNLDVGGAAIDLGPLNGGWPLPAIGHFAFNSQGGVVLYTLIDTANIEDADTIAGWVAWASTN